MGRSQNLSQREWEFQLQPRSLRAKSWRIRHDLRDREDPKVCSNFPNRLPKTVVGRRDGGVPLVMYGGQEETKKM